MKKRNKIILIISVTAFVIGAAILFIKLYFFLNHIIIDNQRYKIKIVELNQEFELKPGVLAKLQDTNFGFYVNYPNKKFTTEEIQKNKEAWEHFFEEHPGSEIEPAEEFPCDPSYSNLQIVGHSTMDPYSIKPCYFLNGGYDDYYKKDEYPYIVRYIASDDFLGPYTYVIEEFKNKK